MQLVKLPSNEVSVTISRHPVCFMDAMCIGEDDPNRKDPLMYRNRPIHTHCTSCVDWDTLRHMSGKKVNQLRLIKYHRQTLKVAV